MDEHQQQTQADVQSQTEMGEQPQDQVAAAQPQDQAMPCIIAEQPSQPVQPTDEELYRAFIGKNADVMAPRAHSHKRFNVFAFFFTAFYFIYRKMYAAGAAVLVINLVLSCVGLYPNLAVQWVTSLIGLAITIACGILFYQLYDKFVTRKVEEIKQTGKPEYMLMKAEYRGSISSGFTVLAVIINILIVFFCSMAFENVYAGWKPIVSDAVFSEVAYYTYAQDEALSYVKEYGYSVDPDDLDELKAALDEINEKADSDEGLTQAEEDEQDALANVHVCQIRLNDAATIQQKLSETGQDDPEAVRVLWKEASDDGLEVDLAKMQSLLNEDNQMPMPWELPTGVLDFSFEFNPFEGEGITIEFKEVGNFEAPVPVGMQIVEGGQENDEPNYCKIQSYHPSNGEYVSLRLVDKAEAKAALKKASKQEGATASVLEMYEGSMEGYAYEQDGISCGVYVYDVGDKYIVGELYGYTIDDKYASNILGEFLDPEFVRSWDDEEA